MYASQRLFWNILEDSLEDMLKHKHIIGIEVKIYIAKDIISQKEALETLYNVTIEPKEIISTEYAKGFFMEKSRKFNVRYTNVANLFNFAVKLGLME